MTTEQFIEKAKKVHSNKYDYSKVEYKKSREKVCIICPEHGEFWQTPNAHLRGHGCSKCNGGILLTQDELMKKFRKIHGQKYDYSKVNYINSDTKVCIVCPKHGEFWQTPNKHLHGHGCPVCSNRVKYTTETFVSKCKEKFGNEFIDYSKVNYVNRNTDILLICKKCGREFFVNPHNHLKRGDGCQYCRMSKLEKNVFSTLTKECIKFEWHKWFNWMNNGKSHKSLDFYLPDYNIAIECQGEQHFKPVDFFGGEKYFNRQVKNDLEKYNKCKEHNIEILYYSKTKNDKNYKTYTELNDLVNEIKHN